MKWTDLLPPGDLLKQVEGVEEGLRKRRRLGKLGVALVLLELVGLVGSGWAWLWVPLIATLVFSFWLRFWLQESRAPFRYTCSVAEFEPVKEAEKDIRLNWLAHDLAEELGTRVRRLKFSEDGSSAKSGSDNQLEHIHISGHFGVRKDVTGRWIIKVMPRVRIGPAGSPETLAHVVRYPLSTASLRLWPTPLQNDAPAHESSPGPSPLPPDIQDYRKLLERVYSSVATEIYQQIKQDVQRKIDLLPTDYFRAVSLFHEAEDYARSNTLNAYEEAERLYDRALQLLDPSLRPLYEWPWPQPVAKRVCELRYWWFKALIRIASRWHWPRPGRRQLMCARAEIGKANMMLYRRFLAGLSGMPINAVFEARPIMEEVVRRLEGMQVKCRERDEALFDAYVTQAMTWHQLGRIGQARNLLIKARSLDPGRADEKARFLFATGEVESHLQSQLKYYRRAVELAPRFEVAQFILAERTEKLWRRRPSLEPKVALDMVLKEYEKVNEINPGNIGAWANRGYILWLLEESGKAREEFENGREYKEIKRETFVSEIDYGLARIEAELGHFEQAYQHYVSAISSYLGQGHNYLFSGATQNMGYRAYHFDLINDSIIKRFKGYRKNVKGHWQERCDLNKDCPEKNRVYNCVYSFVLNDFGEACYSYYSRTGDKTYLLEAQGSFDLAVQYNENYLLPQFNLYQLYANEGDLEKAMHCLERVKDLEPRWPLGIFEWARTLAGGGESFRRRLKNYKDRAEECRRKAQKARAGADAMLDPSYWSSGMSPPEESEKEKSFRMGALSENERKLQLMVGKTDSSRPREKRFRKFTEQEKRASELRKEAEVLESEARQYQKMAESLKRYIEMEKRAVEELPEVLLPHQWLWEMRQGDGRRSFEPWRKLHGDACPPQCRWAKEFNDLHGHALVVWADIQLLQIDPGLAGTTERENIQRMTQLYRHIQRHFWKEDFLVLLGFRKCMARLQASDPSAVEEMGRIDKTLRFHIRTWLREDPTNYQLLRWVNHCFDVDHRQEHLFCDKERKEIFARVLSGTDLPECLCKWLGDQLLDLGYKDEAAAAYAKVCGSTDPVLLLELGNGFERLGKWRECSLAYRKAMREDRRQGFGHRQPGEYRLAIARGLFGRQEYQKSLQELTRIAPDRIHMTQIVEGMLPAVTIPQGYRILKGWLERCAGERGAP